MPGLISVIRASESLQTLHLTEASKERCVIDTSMHFIRHSMYSLLLGLYEEEGSLRYGFPCSLRHLTLIDNKRQDEIEYSDAVSRRPFRHHVYHNEDDKQASLSNLRHLDLDLHHPDLMAATIQLLKPMNLTHLAVSGFAWGQGTPSTGHDRFIDWSSLQSTHLRNLQRFELRHLSYTAHLLSQWRDKVSWCGFQHPKEVFLTQPTPMDTTGFEDDYEVLAAESISIVIWTFACWTRLYSEGLHWCEAIEHLRIDNVDLDREHSPHDLDSDGLDLKSLKVLILNGLPKDVASESVWNLDIDRKPFGRLGRPITSGKGAKSDLRAWGVANAIMRLQCPSLRIVVVNDYHFWISKMDDIGKAGEPQSRSCCAIPMSDAMENEVHRERIAREVTQFDWDFVMNDSPVLPKDARREFVRAANKVVFIKEINADHGSDSVSDRG